MKGLKWEESLWQVKEGDVEKNSKTYSTFWSFFVPF